MAQLPMSNRGAVSAPLSLPVKSRFPETETAVRRDRFDISGYWAKVPSLRSLSKAESPIRNGDAGGVPIGACE
jgi:hypothetical protein